MKNPIRNETSLVLLVAVVFSAISIPALSGFLEPSQPPAVAAVQIGDPRDAQGGDPVGDDGASARPTEPEPQPEPEAENREPRPADGAARGRRAERPAAPAPSAQPAPAAPADDAADDDGGGED